MLHDIELVGARIPTNAEFLRKGEVRRVGYEIVDGDGNALIVTPGNMSITGLRANIVLDTGEIDVDSIVVLTGSELTPDPASATAAPNIGGGGGTASSWEYWIALEAAIPASKTGVSLVPNDYPEIGALNDRYIALCRFEVTIEEEIRAWHLAFALTEVL